MAGKPTKRFRAEQRHQEEASWSPDMVMTILNPDKSLNEEVVARWMAYRDRDRRPTDVGSLSRDYFQFWAITRLPDYVSALHEKAIGLFKEETNSKGVRRVYRKEPDTQALQLILNRLMGLALSPEQDAFNYARALQSREEVESGIMAAKAKQIEAETERTKQDTQVYGMSLIKEEDMDEAVKKMGQVMIGFLMKMPREKIAKAVENEEGYQKFKRSFGRKIGKAAQLALSVSDEEKEALMEALGAEDDEEDE